MQNIFVYGTLLSEPVVKKLTGKSFNSAWAILPDYKIYRVKNRDYPAIVSEPGASANGMILKNMEDSDLEIISYYEGDEYEKKMVSILLKDKPTDVLAFVWKKGVDLLENKAWNLNEFQKKSLEHYLDVVIPVTLKEFHKR